jgi:hypothetical protein
MANEFWLSDAGHLTDHGTMVREAIMGTTLHNPHAISTAESLRRWLAYFVGRGLRTRETCNHDDLTQDLPFR